MNFNSQNIYEDTMWDDARIVRYYNNAVKRILYIGDSISLGTRHVANHLFGDKVAFDGYATSRALDNPFFFDNLMSFAKQEPFLNAIVFNHGLHGWHLSEEEYGVLYADFLDKLLEECDGVQVYVALTTYSESGGFPNDRVQVRNQIVQAIASERNLPVIDLYSVAEANREHLFDGVHFKQAGYEALAREILRAIEQNENA